MGDEDALDLLITGGTALLRIPVAPEWRATIRANLDVSLRHAASVGDFVLPDEAEPAPVFCA